MSPVVVNVAGLRLVINTKEQGHLGRPHCHAKAPGAECSVDLYTFEILESNGFNQPTLNRIQEYVRTYRVELRKKWYEFHGKTKR